MTLVTPFARRITGLFASRVARFVISFAISFLLARILGPAGRGAYALAILVPTALVAVGQLGLPTAMSFFAGRGRSGASLERMGLLLALLLAGVFLGVILLALPVLSKTVLQAAPEELVRIALLSLPFQFAVSFAGSTLIGRQVLRNYNLILIGQSLLMLAGVIVLVGLLDLAEMGAVIANIVAAGVTAVATGLELRRTVGREVRGGSAGPPVGLRELLGYGARIYPASLAGFFNYRIDLFLLSAILGDPRPIGFYTLAVSLAELTFFVPDSVSTVFFPRVAGASRESADRMAPVVTRFTVLLTLLAAVGLIPAAFVAVHLVLPDFTPSLTAFLVILPGIVALSVSKVLASYVGGLGLPLSVASASSGALVINVIANLILIPLLGFVGAAAASLISYSAHAAMLVVIASRLSHRSPLEYLVPTGAEVRRLRDVLGSLLATVGGRRAGREV